MEFYIAHEDGNVLSYDTKEEFLEELALQIDDSEESGGTFFSVEVESDGDCFLM